MISYKTDYWEIRMKVFHQNHFSWDSTHVIFISNVGDLQFVCNVNYQVSSAWNLKALHILRKKGDMENNFVFQSALGILKQSFKSARFVISTLGLSQFLSSRSSSILWALPQGIFMVLCWNGIKGCVSNSEMAYGSTIFSKLLFPPCNWSKNTGSKASSGERRGVMISLDWSVTDPQMMEWVHTVSHVIIPLQ